LTAAADRDGPRPGVEGDMPTVYEPPAPETHALSTKPQPPLS
jgi:hypothetical protein